MNEFFVYYLYGSLLLVCIFFGSFCLFLKVFLGVDIAVL